MKVVLWLLLLVPIGFAGAAWDEFAPDEAGSLWFALLAITFAMGLYARDRLDTSDRFAIAGAAVAILIWRTLHAFIPGLWG